MAPDAPDTSKPLKSPTFEGLRLLLFICFEALAAYQVIEAILSGRTIFPARYNRVVVTASADPGWFIASLIAWALICGIFGYMCWRCWKRLAAALDQDSSDQP
jgi:hypothetical protein